MKNNKLGKEAGRARRTLLKRGASAAAMSAVLANMPREWVAPLVDSVVLPAHAATSPIIVCPTCDVTLSLGPSTIPPACSGGLFPPIILTVNVSTGCSDIEILAITDTLPGQASMTSTLNVGDIAQTGDVFTITIDNYPSSSQLRCLAAEAGSITIEYNCVDFKGPSSSFTIDVLAEILKA